MNWKYPLKSMLYRLSSLLITLFITYLITMSLEISVMIMVLDGITKFIWYINFYKLWEKKNEILVIEPDDDDEDD